MNEPFGLFAGIGVLVFLSCAGAALLRWIDWKRGVPPTNR